MSEIQFIKQLPHHQKRKVDTNYKAPILGGTMAGVTAGAGVYLTSNPAIKKSHIGKCHIKDYINPDIIKEGITPLKELKEILKKQINQTAEAPKNFFEACSKAYQTVLKEDLSFLNKALIVEKLKTAAIIAVPTAIVTGLITGLLVNSKSK